MASKTNVLWLMCCSLALFAVVEQRMTYEKVIRVEKHYIVFDEEHATWWQAFHECRRRGLELLSLESREENEFVQKLIRMPDLPSAPTQVNLNDWRRPPTSSLSVPTNFWTSGRLDEDGYWRWASIGRLLASWTDWAPGQPHVALGRHTPDACLCLSSRHRLRWDAISCDTRLGFICQTRSGPGVAGFPASRQVGEQRVVPPEIPTEVTPHWHGSHQPQVEVHVAAPPTETHSTSFHDTAWLPHASPGSVQLDVPPDWVSDGQSDNRSLGHHYPDEHPDTSNWLAGFRDEHHHAPEQQQQQQVPNEREQPVQPAPDESTNRHQTRSDLSSEQRGPILALPDRVYSFHLSANVTWDDALWSCRLLGATLATIPDGHHNLRITEFIAMQELDQLDFWLDGRMVRTPQDPNGVLNHWLWWSSGLSIGPETNWAPGRPVLSKHDEDRCLVLGVGSTDWKWTNDVCCHHRPYICQHPGPVVDDGGRTGARVDSEKKIFRVQ